MSWIHICMLIVMVVLFSSAEGICNNDKPMTMANEFLISKWRLWYKSLDVNHDGKVSKVDAQECDKNFSEMDPLDALDANKWRISKKALWNECIFRGRTGDILEQEFVNALTTDFNTDNEAFKKEMNRCMNMDFSAADTNEDKSITKDEFIIGMVAYGHQNAASDIDSFSAYNPNNGLVPLSVIVDSWVDFVTNTDDSNNNIVQLLFNADGFE